MKFLYYDLGILKANQIVEITLDAQANVKLLDSFNYQYYKQGKPYKFYGGLAKVSPVTIEVPSAGTWFLVIDLGGYSGKINASVVVL